MIVCTSILSSTATGAEHPRGGEDRLIFKDCRDCPELVFIGSANVAEGQEDKGSEIGFAIGRFEVTFSEWDTCVADGACGGYSPPDNGWGRGGRPVINVSPDDAKEFARWLSKKTGKKYRVPSTAEWEQAATPATPAPVSRYANLANTSCSEKDSDCDAWLGTAPVGSLLPNSFGIFDMIGNAPELVDDCVTEKHLTDDTGKCPEAILKGGGWNYYEVDISRERRWVSIAGRRGGFGFRIVRSVTVSDLEGSSFGTRTENLEIETPVPSENLSRHGSRP